MYQKSIIEYPPFCRSKNAEEVDMIMCLVYTDLQHMLPATAISFHIHEAGIVELAYSHLQRDSLTYEVSTLGLATRRSTPTIFDYSRRCVRIKTGDDRRAKRLG